MPGSESAGAMRRHAAALLVTALLLAACTSDDDDSGDSADTATVTTGSTSTDPSAGPTASGPIEPGRDRTLTLGFLRPAPGLLRELSRAQELAAELAIDDVNAAGGVRGGSVEVVTAEEPLDGDVAGAIESLTEGGADAVLGPVGSSSARVALAPLGASGTLACSASATAPDLTTLDTGGVLYRTAISDLAATAFVADQLVARRDASDATDGDTYEVTIVARTDDFGLQLGNALAAILLERGIDASVLGYHPRRVIFQGEAEEVADAGADAVVVVSYGEAARLVDALLRAGVPADRIVGLGGAFDPRLASRAVPSDPAAIDGLQVIGSTGSRAFVDRLAASPGTDQLLYGAQMYDCVIATALAVHAAGSSAAEDYGPLLADVVAGGRPCSTYADCVASLDAGEDIDYEGPSGGIRFDEHGDAVEARFTVAEFRDAALEEISSTDVDLDEVRQREAFAHAILVTRLQQILTALGYFEGPIDGLESEALTAAIALLQADLGVPVTGVFDAATYEALRARYGELTAVLDDAVAGLQQLLSELGFYDGPIDGVLTRATIDAIRALQRALGVPETGLLDAATLRAAYERGRAAGPATTEPSASDPTVPDPTPAPTAPVTAPPAPTTAPLLPPPPPPDPTTTVPTVPGTPPPAPPTTAPPTTAPPTTAPSATAPPTTAPPTTAPSATAPPTTAPPTTAPPETSEPEDPGPPDPEDPSLLELIEDDPRFTTLVRLLTEAGFVGDVEALGPLTVFAPTNDAFDAIDPTDLDTLTSDPDRFAAVLAYHLAEGDWTLAELAAAGSLATVHGAPLTITEDAGTYRVGDATAATPEAAARNGVLIAVDRILLPPDS